MPKYEQIAEQVLWGGAAIVASVVVVSIIFSIVDTNFPGLLKGQPIPARKPKREVSMPPLSHIKLVLDREEVRNSAERIRKALQECIGRPPALIHGGRGSTIEEFLADATETDIFYFHCSPPESWEGLAGRAGYVKIRDGKPAEELILYMN
ncbi:MAG TPA: hypothetical protein VN283_04815 [Thiobacillus sp.]|nr:hypothetical protein [Thiobacillus sp.]